LWSGAEGWFPNINEFRIIPLSGSGCSLERLLASILDAELRAEAPDEPTTSPLVLGSRFNLRLDWWNDDAAGGSELKTWAGQQKVVSIAKAMHRALGRAVIWASAPDRELSRDLLQYPEVIP